MKNPTWFRIIGWLVFLLIAFQALSQPVINRLEYFIDTDPGWGNGTSVSIANASVVANVPVGVDINALNRGLHHLYVRSRDNNGRWSMNNRLTFLKDQVNSSQINRLEYFVGSQADPGFGSATSVAITPAAVLTNVAVPVNIQSLAPGIHNLYARSRDNNGHWSITNRLSFLKETVSTGNITQMEYFLDSPSDPGFGQATSISFTPGTSVNDIVVPIDINLLATGLHFLYLRSRHTNGSWSITNRKTFLKEILPGQVQQAEYFLNTDPGFGKGISIPITPGNSVNNVLLNLNIASLPTGINQLYIRSQNAKGSWSLTNRWLLLKDNRSGLVKQIEYYYDTDPGFGNGIPVAINASSLLSDYLVPVNVTGLSAGQHVIYLRTKSDRGWSLTNKDTFNVTGTTPTPFINVNSVTQKINCAWASFRISFHATGTYQAQNHFVVQLSDKDGSFAAPVVIGDTATVRSSEVYCTLPSHLPDGTNYRVRLVSTHAVVTGIPNIDGLTIYDRPELGTDTTAFIVCQGETFNLLPLYNTAGFATAQWNTPTPTAAPAGTYQLIVTNIRGCADSANAIVGQDIAVWTGATNKNWHVATNWSTSRVPTEKTHVVIDGSALNNCEMTDTDGAAASVQMKLGGQIKLLNGRKLLVTANCNPLPNPQ